MAYAATMVWEVRPLVTGTSGVDYGHVNNGGGFDAGVGSPGTDYSKQNAPEITFTDLVIDGADNTKATSTGNPFTSLHPGNIVNITSGTGFTVQRAYILSLAAGVATFDRTLGTVGSTGGNGRLGGAVASIQTIAALVVAGNKVWVKAGTDTLTGAAAFGAASVTAYGTIEGYSITRGDLYAESWATSHTAAGFLTTTGDPLIVSGAQLVSFGNFWNARCLNVTSTYAGAGFTMGAACWRYRIKIVNSNAGGSGVGASIGSRCCDQDCEINMSGASSSRCLTTSTTPYVYMCRFTAVSGHGVYNPNGLAIQSCVFYDFAASKHAIQCDSGSTMVHVNGCTFDGVAGICISMPDTAQSSPLLMVVNNQVTNCGTFCNNLRSATTRIVIAGGNNRIDRTTTTYTGFITSIVADGGTLPGDITTAQADADEYVNRSGKDFHLLAAAVGRGAGLPSYVDIGAWQRQEQGKSEEMTVGA